MRVCGRHANSADVASTVVESGQAPQGTGPEHEVRYNVTNVMQHTTLQNAHLSWKLQCIVHALMSRPGHAEQGGFKVLLAWTQYSSFRDRGLPRPLFAQRKGAIVHRFAHSPCGEFCSPKHSEVPACDCSVSEAWRYWDWPVTPADNNTWNACQHTTDSAVTCAEYETYALRV